MTITSAVIEYLKARFILKEIKDRMFAVGSGVQVNDERFNGIGVVASQHDCEPEKLAVLLENGNTWWYPIQNCKPYTITTHTP